MTEPNEPSFPILTVIDGNWMKESPACNQGLTKREHMAIEFTKAYASSEYVAGHVPIEDMAKFGILLADELIKQLNQH